MNKRRQSEQSQTIANFKRRRRPKSQSTFSEAYQSKTLQPSLADHNQNTKQLPIHHKKTSNHIRSFTHATPAKCYRINEQDVYNYVRNSISETFKTQRGRNYALVKQLTEAKTPLHEKQIDRLCEKYSIIKSKSCKKKSFENGHVNVEQITRRYVKSQSKEKQKEENKKRLRKDMKDNYRYGRKKQYKECEQFFSLEVGDDLKNFDKKFYEKKKNQRLFGKQQKSQDIDRHPYLQMYEQAQMEAIMNLGDKKALEIAIDYPSLPEQEDWEKNSQNMRKIIKGVSRFKNERNIQSARPQTSTEGRSKFYLT